MSLENPDDEAEMLAGYTGGKTQTVLPLGCCLQCGACHLEKPFLPIAVIDFFDVTIIPNFCHDKSLHFSALGGMPRRTSWWLNASLIFCLMHAEF